MNNRAMQMIEDAYKPFWSRGRVIGDVVLWVSVESKLHGTEHIETRFGRLKVRTNIYLPKGKAYLMDEPGKKNRGLEWIK